MHIRYAPQRTIRPSGSTLPLYRAREEEFPVTIEAGIQIAAAAAILAFLWSLRRNAAGLRKRMIRLEDLMAGFIRREPAG